MQYDQFIQTVQQDAHLPSRGDAETLARAVIETLGERLDEPARESVMAQLPNELQALLTARPHDTYRLTEFYNRVGARAGLDYYDAAERTWQVMNALRQALPQSEIQIMLDSLPDPFKQLFGEETPGSPRPRP